MNAEEIIKIINELCAKFGIAIDWTSQNVLPYLQELMGRVATYHIVWESIIIALNCILFILMGAGAKAILNSRKKIMADENCDSNFFWLFDGDINGGGICTLIVGGIVLIAALTSTITAIASLLKWIFISEFGLYEYITNLIK